MGARSRQAELMELANHTALITGGTALIDGTTVRIPYRGWFLPDGASEERNGAIPDLLIQQTPEDESRDFDAQLKAAVDDLLKRAG